ncbi:MAG: M23 family metallopeptidase [Candidatus Saccharicenans sp.]
MQAEKSFKIDFLIKSKKIKSREESKKTVNKFLFFLNFIGFFLILLSAGGPAFSAETKTVSLATGDVLELRYREIKPGEPLVLVWKEKKSDFLDINFLKEKRRLESGSAQQPFLFLGVDLATSPGVYALEVSAWQKKQISGRAEIQLEVRAREFPKKELKVDQKYVTPPKQVQERIRREAELLAEIYSLSTPEWLAGSHFILPCDGKLFPNFGQQRIYNRVPRSVHAGIDIAVPVGHPIKATNGGRVVLASDLYFSGKTVIVDHGLGLFSTYCHLSRILVKRGEKVEAGQVIGLAGSTGLSTGPHLHWAVRINEARVDPLSLLELEF